MFNYLLDGLLADEGTEFWKFCFDLPENREPDDPAQLDFLQSAYAHIMGRTAYQAIAGSMRSATGHPFAPILNAACKAIFSRTLKTAGWASTTIAAGDTALGLRVFGPAPAWRRRSPRRRWRHPDSHRASHRGASSVTSSPRCPRDSPQKA